MIALPPGTLSNSPVLAADFNSDGKLDLAVLKFDTSVSRYELQVLIGHGDGTFQVGPFSALLGPAISIAAGDFNGDHHVDLVLELNTAVTMPSSCRVPSCSETAMAVLQRRLTMRSTPPRR